MEPRRAQMVRRKAKVASKHRKGTPPVLRKCAKLSGEKLSVTSRSRHLRESAHGFGSLLSHLKASAVHAAVTAHLRISPKTKTKKNSSTPLRTSLARYLSENRRLASSVKHQESCLASSTKGWIAAIMTADERIRTRRPKT